MREKDAIVLEIQGGIQISEVAEYEIRYYSSVVKESKNTCLWEATDITQVPGISSCMSYFSVVAIPRKEKVQFGRSQDVCCGFQFIEMYV